MKEEPEVMEWDEYVDEAAEKLKAASKETTELLNDLSWEVIEKGVDALNKMIPKLKKLKGLLFD